ncbi:MAG: type II/IV secretion system protein [Patescibacteria group bacterium]|mgnify:CR=1 FL=1
MLKFSDETEVKKLAELHGHEAEALADMLSAKYQIPYIDLSKFPINTDALRLISETDARKSSLAAFKLSGRNLFLVTISPEKQETKNALAELREKNYNLNLYLGSQASLDRAWSRYKEISRSTRTEAGVIDISNEAIAEFTKKINDLASLNQLFSAEGVTALAAGGISNLLEVLLAGGIVTKASDIHIEPQAERVRVRFRLDGVLHDVTFLEHKLYNQILSRVKLLSGLKLNIKKSAQDGRLSIRLNETDIEIRTSILPGAYGESIVLRLLNPEAIAVTFETLGIEPQLFEIVKKEITKPNGAVFLTGPTGSGKTTTLYAFLRYVSNSENKIITIEDPIEYHLQGINQTQVNPDKNYTFLTGLRSALRQDPDIIMVGEIRDKETAKIAINASLTGHLVFSTLHTNNAAGTVPRLIDLDVNPKIIDSALNLAMAQRLVRNLCPVCKEKRTPTSEEKKLLDAVLESIKVKRPTLVLPSTDQVLQPKVGGCDECNHTGYRGRQGLFEAIMIDNAVAALLVENPSEREIKIAARPQGILDMRQDGVLKVLKGETDLGELSRVVDIHEEIL